MFKILFIIIFLLCISLACKNTMKNWIKWYNLRKK